MAQNFSVEVPFSPSRIRLPAGVDDRLQTLLDKQDRGESLTAAERKEADGLVELAEMLSLIRLRATRASKE